MSAILPLEEFIPALSPRFDSPLHLRPMLDVFARIARGESVRVVVNVPPRHAKTESLIHGTTWLQVQDPGLQVAYCSYASRIAEKKSRKARQLAEKAGIPIASDSRSRQDWRTDVDDGGMWATSVDGQITGEGFHLVVLDDLLKGRAAAESGAVRERTHAWLVADVLTRLEPGGSVICNGTRWHPDDPSGRLIADGWEHINLPAINAAGAALWPERWPLSELNKIRETLGGEDGYEWTALYQGNPRGRGSRVFGDVQTYDARPESMRVSIGLDFAYSTRTSADYSVAVVLGEAGGNFYLLDVVRVRLEPREFRGRVQLLHETYPGAKACAYAAATEMGGIEFLRDGGIRVDGRTATMDKFTRAIPVAAAWNSRRVLLPASAPWLDALVSEVCGFTGVNDRHDDQVDALAAAFDALAIASRSAGAYRAAREAYRDGPRLRARDLGHVGDGQWHDFAPPDRGNRRRSQRF